MTKLTTEEYRELLAIAPANAFDADSDEPDLRRLFTPANHRLALDPDVTLVRGARGTGKTVWYKVLNDDRLREIAATSYMMPRLGSLRVSGGHGTAVSPDCYPGPEVVEGLVDSGVRPADIWSAVVLVALGAPEILAEREWADKCRWVKQNPEPFDRVLLDRDREAQSRRRTHLILFDALEHLHADRKTQDMLVSGLLQVALRLRLRTRTVRAKVFIRPDMYDSASKQFADASKLGANPVDLEWSTENLYGLLFHQLGNSENPLAAGFRAETGEWHNPTDSRYVAPVDVIADKGRQQEVFAAMAGQHMGTSHRAGYTYTWLPNHLQDGRGRVSPRSFLRAVTRAAEVTRDRYATHGHALHHEAIRRGVQEASRVRVDETTGDIPWVAEAVRLLEGEQVPVDPVRVHVRWDSGKLTETLNRRLAEGSLGTGPQDTGDYSGLISELVGLGVMTRRQSTGKLDLPDVYRIAFGIGRKGGVRRHSTRTPSR